MRGAGQVAQVFPEVVPAGGTNYREERTDLGETSPQVSELPGAAAKSHLMKTRG